MVGLLRGLILSNRGTLRARQHPPGGAGATYCGLNRCDPLTGHASQAARLQDARPRPRLRLWGDPAFHGMIFLFNAGVLFTLPHSLVLAFPERFDKQIWIFYLLMISTRFYFPSLKFLRGCSTRGKAFQWTVTGIGKGKLSPGRSSSSPVSSCPFLNITISNYMRFMLFAAKITLLSLDDSNNNEYKTHGDNQEMQQVRRQAYGP